MQEIYYKDGIYLVIDNDDDENDICVYNYNKGKVSLYGGRIKLSSKNGIILTIDGVLSVIQMYSVTWSDGSISHRISKELSIQEVVSHLNAIETNGVDAFIEHYKKSIEFLYGELKELSLKKESQLTIEQEDSTIKNLLSELGNIRDLLFSVLAILFNLYTHMSAGLENEKVVSVCQSIMDSLA